LRDGGRRAEQRARGAARSRRADDRQPLRDPADGGAKLIWGGEAFAVREDGRANPNQLYLNRDVDCKGGLAELLDGLRAAHSALGERTDDLYVGLQLTHSGRFSRPRGAAQPMFACHHPVLDARCGIASDAPPLTDGELEGIGERYVLAAELAAEVGFDFVDIKCCHGYLMHELLGAKTRAGAYGGSFDGRTRLFRRIVDGIRSACGGLDIACRVSVGDVWPHSTDPQSGIGTPDPRGDDAIGFGIDATDPSRFDLTEPLRFLRMQHELGIGLVNLSLGSPYYCPHLQRPAAYPPSDGYLPPEDPLASVARHIRAVRRCKAAIPELRFVGSAYSYLQEWLPNVAEHEVREGHVDFVGLGRMVLVYPDIARDVLLGRPLERKRICRTFSDCTTAPRNGMLSGCFPLDPYYRDLPQAARLKAIKRGAER
jgi:NADPH2 dehydrogenase